MQYPVIKSEKMVYKDAIYLFCRNVYLFITQPFLYRLVETNSDKTTCECSEFGAIAVIVEMSEKFEVNDKCPGLEILKYIGIGFSFILLSIFCIMVLTRKYIHDMFHGVRVHVCLTWILALAMHIVSDFDTVRDKEHLNLIISIGMVYFYTASATWIACEAHAIFKVRTYSQ